MRLKSGKLSPFREETRNPPPIALYACILFNTTPIRLGVTYPEILAPRPNMGGGEGHLPYLVIRSLGIFAKRNSKTPDFSSDVCGAGCKRRLLQKQGKYPGRKAREHHREWVFNVLRAKLSGAALLVNTQGDLVDQVKMTRVTKCLSRSSRRNHAGSHLQGRSPSHFFFRPPHASQLLRIPFKVGLAMPLVGTGPDSMVFGGGPVAEGAIAISRFLR